MPSSLPIVPPLTRGEMERLRLRMRRRLPSSGLGAHLHRRMGQSMEFREFRDYHMGDDIRNVDWLASMRLGDEHDWVVRSFEAEERRTVMFVLDARPAMMLPKELPKLHVACWSVQCLAAAAFAERDRVLVGTIFGPSEFGVLPLEGERGARMLAAYCTRLLRREIEEDTWEKLPGARAGELTKRMRPASAIVLLSDMLFDASDAILQRFAQTAQQSFRTLSVVEIDSWPMERGMILERPFRLGALEGRRFGAELREASESLVAETDRRIAEHKETLRRTWRGPGLIWPARPIGYPDRSDLDSASLTEWFRATFQDSACLPGLLWRAAA